MEKMRSLPHEKKVLQHREELLARHLAEGQDEKTLLVTFLKQDIERSREIVASLKKDFTTS